MTISVDSLTAAGSVQINRASAGIGPQARTEPQQAAPAVGGSSPTVSATTTQLRQAQALARLDGEHQVADLVKHTDGAMRAIGQKLEQMQDTLRQVVKQYPPYPLESRERMELLNSLPGLRKQIDALTMPPPDREPVTLLGDPERQPGAGDVSFTLDGETRTLSGQPAHSGPDGLDLPELAPQASDQEVQQALEQVTQSREKLEARRTALAQELESILFPRQDSLDQLLSASRHELASQSGSITGSGASLDALN